MIPVGTNNYNPGWGQYPNYPQAVIVMPMQGTGGVTNFNPYNPVAGQFPSVPQTIILVPVPVTGMPTGVNPYNPGWGQYPSVSQPPQSWPIPPTQNPVGFNSYNPQVGQPTYYPQTQTPLPPPLNSNPVGFNSYNPGVGQGVYYPQTQTPLPPPLNSNQVGFNSYNPGVGQGVYYPQTQTPLPPPLNSNPVGTDSYNPGWGQYPVYQQNAPVPPGFINSNPVPPNGYNPIVGQSPYPAQLPSILPNAVPPNTQFGQLEPNQPASLLRSTALRSPSLQAQGAYVVQGESSVARARLSGLYPLTPNVVFGATLDLTSEDSGLADSPNQGLNINELFFATAPFDNLPNLRFVVGQLDLTSYFDRNSFAKDGVTHFFNPAFQTNPALSATGIASKPAFLVNWTLNDSIEAKAAAFSSARNIGDFALDGFAGEIAFRYGNAIVRGTYATDRDAGSETGFQEIFSIPRGDNGEVGLESGDREEAYGLNAEYFVPDWNMGVFARYGRYINREIDEAATTYSFGVSFLDVFLEDDRLGLGYGQNLSNNQGQEKPDVLELFYDFRFLPNLRLGFTLQQRNGFTETDVGVRVKTDFDVIPTNN
ncbi:MAG TPA: porin [Cyanobacteria bacterium UBA12227]|nr:porin [Cyanobacteria bacterium UBA12227]